MKKLLLALLILASSQMQFAYCADNDSLYEAAQPFESKLYNDVDPYQDEDTIKYSWSPYPLFRTSTDLYFKDITIPPGYYLLTPRNLKGRDFVLFKQNGKVEFIIPAVKKEATPINFYDANVPKIKLNGWQKFTSGVRKKFYDTAKDSGRVTPPSSYVNVEVEVKYIIITLYYGEDKYTLLFKRSPY